MQSFGSPVSNRLPEGVHVLSADLLRNDPAREGALNAEGRLQVLPASFWSNFNQAEIAYFCVARGFYCLPTTELVDWLLARIAGRTAIEIGAGNGVLAETLGIPGTDNQMQNWPEIRNVYLAAGQAPVPYGENVLPMDALAAVGHYHPQVVIAAWVTHRWSAKEAWREGNQWGVEEREIIKRAEYIHIGNRHVHRNKPALDVDHEDVEAPWLISRAMNGTPNVISIWRHRNY